jgi:arabinose-5-phosphate isomerase
MQTHRILKRARKVFDLEANAILLLTERLDKNFLDAIDVLFRCKGKVVVTGLGLSGLICQKIAATLSSTGTPALFLHASDAAHGDLGMIAKEDVVLAVSESGESDEILKLLPVIKHFGLQLIVMSGNPKSTLSLAANVVLHVGVDKEACPLGLTPTASTAAALAMGDALAMVLMENRQFQEEDFARRHPGGILGRKLFLRVKDLMRQGGEVPVVSADAPMKETLFEISSKRLGITSVIDGQGELVGVITDGDLRRGLENNQDIFRLQAKHLMSRNPKTIAANALAAEAVAVMEQHSITSLFVLADGTRKHIGVIHLHDLIKAGIT